MFRFVAAVLLGTALCLSACAPDSGESPSTVATPTIAGSSTTSIAPSTTPGAAPPSTALGSRPTGQPVPLVVLVPGGGWVTADPGGLVPLAEELTRRGAVAVTITYGAAADGVHFPEQAEDVACAVARSAAEHQDLGHTLGEVVVVGHSAGAHLGSLVALQPAAFSTTCPDPPVEPDRFVGLAGPYDVVLARGFAVDLFGPQNPDTADWAPGNPMEHVEERPDVPMLLIHGEADRTVPIRFTESFANALERGGHAVTTVYPESADHHTIYTPDIAAAMIADWLDL